MDKACNVTPYIEFTESVFEIINKETGEKQEGSLFDRIAINDICWIELYYTDNTMEEIHVSWSDKSDYINYYQSTQMDKDGNLIIVIDKNNEAEK